MNKKRKGFTIIEVLTAVSFLLIIVSLSVSMLIGSLKSQKQSYDEYDVQSSIRIATQQTDRAINEATAIFTIPENRFKKDNLTAGWDYYGVLPDKRQIVRYTYDSDLNNPEHPKKHKTEILVQGQEGIKYDLIFKRPTVGSKKFIQYSLEVLKNDEHITDGKIVTELEAKNAQQVVFRDSLVHKAVAIATRSDDIKTNNVIALVTVAVDNSGSMEEQLDGSRADRDGSNSRLANVKGVLSKLLDGLSEGGTDVYVSLVPFSFTANYPDPALATSGAQHKRYKLKRSDHMEDAKKFIDNMKAAGGTNTGDALRRSFYTFYDFEQYELKNYPRGTKVKHYLILLTDGEPTTSSVIWVRDSKRPVTHRGIRRLRLRDSLDPKFYYGEGALDFNARTKLPRSLLFDWAFFRPNKRGTERLAAPGGGDTAEYYNGSYDVEDWAMRYAKKTAGFIRDKTSKSPRGDKTINSSVKSFLIGFNSKESVGLEDIGNALIPDSPDKDKQIFDFKGRDLNLDDVFSEIKDSILEDIWFIKGPDL